MKRHSRLKCKVMTNTVVVRGFGEQNRVACTYAATWRLYLSFAVLLGHALVLQCGAQ